MLAWLAVLLTATTLWLVPRGARACSCRELPPPDLALAEADAVFEARPFGMSTDGQRALYAFEVDRVWKGEVPPRVPISTALQSATCGRSFQIGTQYVIYAHRNADGDLTDNLCSRTRTHSAAAEDLQVLGAGHEPRSTSPDSSTGSASEPAEPPRIETPPVEPPPTEPSRRGCAVEKPHTSAGPAGLAMLGLLVIAIRRRRAVRSPA